MYKRRARILFVGAGTGGLAEMAAAWARQLGGEWLEGRCALPERYGANPRAAAVMLEGGVDLSRHPCMQLSEDLLEWADLVVTLGAAGQDTCPALPAGKPVKHWPLDDPAQAAGTEETIMAAYRQASEATHSRVASMIGGMRMLARSHIAVDDDDGGEA